MKTIDQPTFSGECPDGINPPVLSIERTIVQIIVQTIVQNQGALPGAISTSIVLHILVFLLLFSNSLPQSDDFTGIDDESDPGIAVRLMKARPPSAAMTEDLQMPDNRQSLDPQPIVEEPVEPVEPIQFSGTQIDTPPEAMAGLTEIRQNPESATGSESRTLLNSDQSTAMAIINQSISHYVNDQKDELNREYVESCVRYRNRYGLNSECPEDELLSSSIFEEEKLIVDELFASINRKSNDARLGRQLERENRMLMTLLDEDNPAIEQVQTRLALNTRYINFLNGNVDPLLAHMSATAFGNDYGRTLVVKPYQFRCRGGPCIYRFTGFTAKRPPNYVQKAPSFPSQTPLFMPSK